MSVEFRLLTVELLNELPPTLKHKGSRGDDHCTIRFVGRTMDGRSVCLWASGFYPYFYLRLPEGWSDWQLIELEEYIKRHGGRSMTTNLVNISLQRSHVTYCFSDNEEFPFAKLSFRGVRSMQQCARLFRDTLVALAEDDEPKAYEVCEVRGVPPLLKALHDTDIQPSGWVRVERFQVVNRESRTDLNIHAPLANVTPFASDDIPPFVEASFDGEMVSATYEFPRAERPYDAVVQLAMQFSRYGEEQPYYRALFCLDVIDKIEQQDVDVRRYATESALLLDFAAVLLKHNPDIVTGYNINGFDIPYLINRGKKLKLPPSFFLLGRFDKEPTELKEARRDEDKPKKIRYETPVLPGRRVEDCMVTIRKFLKKKETSYRLDHVATVYLGVGKHDMDYEDLFKAYQDVTDRARAQHQVPVVQSLLTEVRLMLAVESLPQDLALAELCAAVVSKWPEEYQQSIDRTLVNLVQNLPLSEANTASEVLRAFRERRSNGDALLCDDKHLIDLRAPWFLQEASSLNALLHNTEVPAAEEGEGLAWWEVRLQAETEVLEYAIAHKTTRAFAEKWWGVRRDMRACDNAEEVQRATDYLEAERARHVAHLLSEKTRVGSYCVMDAELPSRIRRKQQHLISLMEMSKVSRVPCNMLMEKGETIKVINLFVLWCRNNNHVATLRALPQVHFKGGQVLQPIRDFYRTYVATLDFSSLYPSLIQSLKLCFKSLIHPDDVAKYRGREDLDIVKYNIGPPSNQDYYWVRNCRTALPEILATLVGSRSAVKAELKKETDPNRQVILEQRQLAIKLVANSAYGFTGFEFSPWPCLPIAVCTTVNGRNAINSTKKLVEDEFGCKVVYGDSVTWDTPVLIRMPPDTVQYMCIADIPLCTPWYRCGSLHATSAPKEWAVPVPGTHVWSDRGFTPLRRVIRHCTYKEIYGVCTRTGYVQVTSDHSLLTAAGEKVRPTECQGGRLLHHALPKDTATLSPESAALFLQPGSTLPARYVCTEMTRAAEVIYLAHQMGRYTTIEYDDGYLVVTATNEPVVDVCPQLIPLGTTAEPVYDLETDNHHFAAGPGTMVVHNTDSVMIIFPGLDEMPKKERLPYVFRRAEEAAERVTQTFTKPMRLEFEKVYCPYLLMNKKRYAGQKYMALDKPPSIDMKGIEAIRRDNCSFLRDTVKGTLDILLNTVDPGKAVKHARRSFARLAQQKVTMEELIISKTLGEDYASDALIHVQVAQYLEKHYPLLAPQPGDRVPYVVIKLPNETRNTKNYMKGMNPTLAERGGHEIDWAYYCFKQIKRPLDRIFCIVFGHSFDQSHDVQLTDYLWEPYLTQIRENDLVQRERVSGHREISSFFTKRPRVEPVDDEVDNMVDKTPEAPPPKPRLVQGRNANLREMFNKSL